MTDENRRAALDAAVRLQALRPDTQRPPYDVLVSDTMQTYRALLDLLEPSRPPAVVFQREPDIKLRPEDFPTSRTPVVPAPRPREVHFLAPPDVTTPSGKRACRCGQAWPCSLADVRTQAMNLHLFKDGRPSGGSQAP